MKNYDFLMSRLRRRFIFLLLAIVLGLILCFCVACISEGSSVAPVQQKEHTRITSNKPPLKVVIFGDQSASQHESAFPRIVRQDIEPLVDYINQYGGEMVLGMINNASKEEVARYRSQTPPRLSPQRSGESAVEYSKRIQDFHEEKKAIKAENSQAGKGQAIFEKKVEHLLNYKEMSMSSDVGGAIELAKMILSERDDALAEANKYAIFVTDGIHTGGGALPRNFSYPLVMVCSESDPHDLQGYQPILQTTVAGAVRIVLQQ